LGWASQHIERLRAGQTIQFRPRGHSMTPRIRSGELCTVAPLAADDALLVDDVVLCCVGQRQYLHLVKSVQDGRYLIGNQRGGINGWIHRTAIHGKLVRVERPGR
jgi:hypothetical protein